MPQLRLGGDTDAGTERGGGGNAGRGRQRGAGVDPRRADRAGIEKLRSAGVGQIGVRRADHGDRAVRGPLAAQHDTARFGIPQGREVAAVPEKNGIAGTGPLQRGNGVELYRRIGALHRAFSTLYGAFSVLHRAFSALYGAFSVLYGAFSALQRALSALQRALSVVCKTREVSGKLTQGKHKKTLPGGGALIQLIRDLSGDAVAGIGVNHGIALQQQTDAFRGNQVAQHLLDHG